ncbi:MAG: hypothetical protein WD187_03500 [Candidatus Woykebacteria bacterium]
MATKKELSWEFVRETFGKKYFLVKKEGGSFFIFRTPKSVGGEAKDHHTLENWEGEITPWGGIPLRVRRWLRRMGLKPDPKNQKDLQR